jgi:hypothetical protein
MTDAILSKRLDALETNLKRVQDSLNPIQSLFSKVINSEVIHSRPVWIALEDTIQKEVSDLLDDVQTLRKNNDSASAWSSYGELLESSQPLFHECLELLGGLAFRANEFDSRICHVADWLIHECAVVTRQEPSLTVPASREALHRTIARLIRLPFPELSIWTLPFTAQEYAHVVLPTEHVRPRRHPGGSSRPPAELVKMECLPSPITTELRQALQTASVPCDDCHTAAKIVVDAFATYIMGPAYASAAIHLRLPPSADANIRANVILATLKCLDIPGGNEIEQKLRGAWDKIGAQADMVSTNAWTITQTNAFVKVMLSRFKAAFPSVAPFSRAGWALAQFWSNKWTEELKHSAPELAAADPTNDLKLRDVVNAAWCWRLYHEPEANEGSYKEAKVAAAAVSLCNRVIGAQSSGGGRRRSPKTSQPRKA